MFPDEERKVLKEALVALIVQNVPGAVEHCIHPGAFAYQTSETAGHYVFCLILNTQDHVELRFPVCPSVVASNGSFERVPGTRACRLLLRTRSDAPGEILNRAIKEAAGAA